MVSILALWLPILLSAAFVFVASSVIHMFLPYHNTDYRRVPAEDDVADALRSAGVAPGDYVVPHAEDAKARQSPEFKQKVDKGPVAFITVRPSGDMGMGKGLAQWFAFCVVVGIFAAYVAGRALPPGAEYLDVFRFAGTTAFIGYTLAQWSFSIWFGRAWSTTLKFTFDGLIYALLTAGIFGWLWPA